MSGLRQYESLESADLPLAGAVHLAIGMFDGLHRGHRMVIDSAKKAAAEEGGVCGVLTFWPHPSRLFRPQDPARMILTPEIKRIELGKQGIDFLIEEPFSKSFADIPAEEFVLYLIRRLPSLRTLHVGENWRFGRGRSGDSQLLVALGEELGVAVRSVNCLAEGGERVSSTRIRNLLKGGAVAEANGMLGYRYYSIGTVTQGKRLGRSIQAPTLNLPFEGDLKPAYGVYAVTVCDVSLQHQFKGVANFGIRPTVEETKIPLLEVHLLESCPFDYGHRLRVSWHHFLRGEKKFDGLDALRLQIAADVEAAKLYFEESGTE